MVLPIALGWSAANSTPADAGFPSPPRASVVVEATTEGGSAAYARRQKSRGGGCRRRPGLAKVRCVHPRGTSPVIPRPSMALACRPSHDSVHRVSPMTSDRVICAGP